MGPWRCLRVMLHRKQRPVRHRESGHRLIVQIDVRDFAPDRLQRARLDRESMVLARDLDSPGNEVQHRLVQPPVPELQLVRLRPERQREQLVPETDPESRDRLRLIARVPHNLSKCVDCPGNRRGVSRAVRNEQPIRLARRELLLDLARPDVVRHNPHVAPAIGQVPQDVSLGPAIERENAESLRRPTVFDRPLSERLGPFLWAATPDLRDEIRSSHIRRLLRRFDQLRIRQVRLDNIRNHAAHHAPNSQTTRQGSCINARQSQHPVLRQVRRKVRRRPEVGHHPGKLPYHEARDLNFDRLDVLLVDTGIPDQRGRHDENLAPIRRVRQGLLIPRHRGVEHYLRGLGDPLSLRPERPPVKHRAILQSEAAGTLICACLGHQSQV